MNFREGTHAIVTASIVQYQRVRLAERRLDIGILIQTKSAQSNSQNGIIHSAQGHHLGQGFGATVEPLPLQVMADITAGAPPG